MRLTSIGGLEGHENGDHWFLAGYALEDFLKHFVARPDAKAGSIETAVASDGSNYKYLEAMSILARDSRQPTSLLSPFEVIQTGAPVTTVEARLGSEELARAHTWCSRHPKAVLYAYAGLDLEVEASSPSSNRASEPLLSNGAFQELFNDGRETNLFFAAHANFPHLAPPGTLEISLRAQSEQWLEGDNMKRLVDLAEAVLHAADGLAPTASLNVKGSSFRQEEARIRATFAPLLANIPPAPEHTF
ncbi:MAG TPA: hypothetical protein VHO06_14375 [Polyangia bacterium]|nr:hypothetical protein [Polyangia bacterium]